MYRLTYDDPEGCVLVLIRSFGSCKVTVTNVGRSCSRMQNIPVLFPTGGRTAIPSGRIRQNLFFAISSFDWPSRTLLVSVCVRGRSISRALAAFHIVSCVRFRYCRPSISDGISFQSVCRHFSPKMHKNFRVGAANRASSPWISRQLVTG